MSDLHTWEVTVIDVNDQPLATFMGEIHHSLSIPDRSFYLKLQGTYITTSGIAFAYLVTRDGKLFARNEKLYASYAPLHLVKGSYDPGVMLLIEASSILSEQTVRPKVCTCGGWAVYGKEANIHSDDRVNTCELRMS